MDVSRRNLLKRAGVISGAALVAPAALAACASDAATGSSSASVGAAPSLVKPTTKVTLRLWTWAWPAEPLATEYKKAFEAVYPEIDLQVKQFAFPDYIAALATSMPSGQAGDVFHLQVGSQLRKYSKFLAPVEPLAASSFGSDWESQYVGGSVAEIRSSVSDGTLYALPQSYAVGGIMWDNEKVMSDAGLALPGTYAELLSASAKLRESNISAVAWGAKDQWPNTDFLIQFSSQWTPGIVEAAEAGRASFTDEAIVNGLNFMKRSMDEGIYNKAPFSTTAFPDAYNNFFYGKSAFASVGTWGVNLFDYEKVSADGYSAFLFPQLPDTPDDAWINGLPTGSPVAPAGSVNPVRPWRTTQVVAAMRNDLDPDRQWAASKFLEYWCGKDGQIEGAATWTPAFVGVQPPLAEKWKPIYEWMTSLGAFGEKREFDYDQTRTALQDAIASVCVNGADAKVELAKVDVAAEQGRSRAGS